MIESMKHLKTHLSDKSHTESDAQGFEALFLEHWESVVRVLRRLVSDPAEAEDLALEAFMRLYRLRQKRAEIQNTGGWLYRVATHLGLNAIRDGKRREHYELTAGRFALDDPDQPGEIQAREEERQQVRYVLSQMDERQAQLLILRYSGLSYREIASALQVAPASIGPLLVRAERAFEKQYRSLVQEV